MKIRRIRAAALLVAVLIFLIGTVPVLAANTKEEYDNFQYDFLLETQYQYQKYRVAVDGTTDYKVFRVIQSGNNTDVIYYVSSNNFATNTRYFLHGKDRDDYYYLMPWVNKTAETHIVQDQGGNDVTFYMSAAIIYSHDDVISGNYQGTLDMDELPDDYDYYQALYDAFLGKKDIPGYTPEKPAFPTDDNMEYDADLGYLKNIEFKLLNVYTSLGYETYLKFNWNTVTTTGIDLTDPDVDVQFMIKVQGTGTYLTGTVFNTSTESSGYLLVSDYSDNAYSLVLSDSGSMDGGADDIYTELRRAVMKQQPLICKTFDILSNVYFRPITYDDGWKYGGWSKVAVKYDAWNNGNYDYEYTVTDGITDDGTIPKDNLYGDDDGLSPDNSYSGSGTAGSGNTLDEADNNTTTNPGDSSGDLVSNVKSMLSMITEIPAILGSLFSFLPGWCLTLLAVGVGLIMVLIVYKLIRG